MRDTIFSEEMGVCCPRCNAQIVLWRGEFTCSICGLDTQTWQRTMTQERLTHVREWAS